MQANELACLLQAALSSLRPCLIFGLISSRGYCLNVWTFKGCAGRLNAAKCPVEGIAISTISKVPQTLTGRGGRGCAGRGCPCAGVGAARNQRDPPVTVKGEKNSRTSEVHCQNLEGEVALVLPPHRCDQKDISASRSGV